MSWDLRLHQSGFEALYVHIPFCIKRCAYCDFYSQVTQHGSAAMTGYVDELVARLTRAADAGVFEHTKFAYIGGGTPSMLGADLVRLVREIRGVCPELKELTSEANPESLSAPLAFDVQAAGLTRLSIGVQSAQDRELAALGRIHSAAEAEAAIRAAVAAGLDVSCDLMCAIPDQSMESWADSLARVMSWGPTHISVYPLQIEEGTALAKRLGAKEPSWNSSDVQADRMSAAAQILEQAGFKRYEVASFAQDNKMCQHNLCYWQGKTYAGVGSSAAGMMSAELYDRLRDFGYPLPARDGTFTRVRSKRAAHTLELEFLSERQACAEDLMLASRLVGGISFDQLDYAGQLLGKAKLHAALESLLARGLVQERQQAIVPTKQGWLLGNELYETLWSLAGEFATKTLEVTV